MPTVDWPPFRLKGPMAFILDKFTLLPSKVESPVVPSTLNTPPPASKSPTSFVNVQNTRPPLR